MPLPLLGPSYSPFAGLIGVARVDITPPVGIFARNWGAATHDVADSIHRPLTLTAVTFRTGDEPPLILIDADLGFWTALDRFQSLHARLLEELKLDSARLIFAMTHTHASPHLCHSTPGMAGGELLDEWIETLGPAAIRAVREAFRNEEPSTLEWHWGKCQLAATRDLLDPADPSRRICGFNPEVPADDTLLVGRICGRAGAVRAVIANYACHPTTLAWSNHAISPDFIGAMRETIEAAHPGARGVYLHGASGEMAPRYQYVGDASVADRHGRQLAYSVLATLEDMEAPGTRLAFEGVMESGAPLAVWRPQPATPSTALAAIESTVALPLKADLPTYQELDEQFRRCEDRALAERLRRKRDIRRILGHGTAFALPVWAWRIGDAVFVGCMAEAYSQAQTELRAKFPGLHLVVMNLINGTIGYLTPADRYGENLYQVWQSPFAEGCLERYIETLADLIGRLTSDDR